ncbi:MAG: hypothetical protein ACUVQY_07455 [Thermoproteota archaeon]
MRWMVKKASLSAFTLFCAITINFFLYRLMPGNPVDMMIQQYMALGYSIWLATPVTTILGYGIPWTVFSVSISLVISFMPGIIIGMYMAELIPSEGYQSVSRPKLV